MRHFLKMLELAKTTLSTQDRQEFFSYASEAHIFVLPYMFSIFSHESMALEQHNERLEADLDTCCLQGQIERKRLMIQNLDKLHALMDQDMKLVDKLKDSSTVKFDAPFPVISVEILDGDIIVDNHKCVVAAEVSPNHWKYWWYCKNIEGGYCVSVICEDLHIKIFWSLIDRINHQSVGTEQVRQRVKIGTGKDKKILTIRQITYVYPKQQERPTHAPSGREINWSHRWFVRGHWRKANGLGKNREGVYCVAEWTWVKEHIKGTGDLIKKAHVVKKLGDVMLF
jgi:hypothetical protein